jgi:elongation factor 1-beta
VESNKSAIVYDVKPYDDETDVAALLEKIKKIEMDGLVWGEGLLYFVNRKFSFY